MLLDTKFIDSQTSEWQDVVNPATQEVLAQVPFATDAEIHAAIASAKRAYKTWKNTPLAARARILLKLQSLVRAHPREPHRANLERRAGQDACGRRGGRIPRSRGGRARLLDRQPAAGGIC